MQKIKVNDEVICIAGRSKGQTGKVLRLNLKKGKAYVEGLNMVKKTMKPTQENAEGGIVEIEASINISNIACVSPKTSKATRVRIEERDGKKVRVAVKCGSVL